MLGVKEDSEKNIHEDREGNEDSLRNEKMRRLKVIIPSETLYRFREGDHRAFETIFHTFYERVKSFVKILTKNEDSAEELTQQAFVDLWINREKVNPDKNISAYIYTIARNNTITALKQQMKSEILPLVYTQEVDTVLPDDRIIAQETELLINLTVASMPERRRLVYQMSRNENKSNEEIAKELDISRKVVEKHIRLAINELRKVIRSMFLLFF